MCIPIEPVHNDHPEPRMHISLLPPVHNTHLYTTSPQCSHPHHQSTIHISISPVNNVHTHTTSPQCSHTYRQSTMTTLNLQCTSPYYRLWRLHRGLVVWRCTFLTSGMGMHITDLCYGNDPSVCNVHFHIISPQCTSPYHQSTMNTSTTLI